MSVSWRWTDSHRFAALKSFFSFLIFAEPSRWLICPRLTCPCAEQGVESRHGMANSKA